ncbi:MAG: hypothetical protein IKU58_08860 [Clostridia bacterium]|nr:hypothetical protein [Clostridia bacterium]
MERILQKALTLCGGEDNERSRLLLETVCERAAAYCGRRDIPAEMEGAVALLLAGELEGGTPDGVRSVKRGDTTITYADGSDPMAALKPFARLRAPEKRRWCA